MNVLKKKYDANKWMGGGRSGYRIDQGNLMGGEDGGTGLKICWMKFNG